MNHIGLFEGIGGFSLAARWMGWETIAWCEINPFGQKVLSHHFPKAKPHHDIKQTDFTIYRGKCDILTGGFPCQPYSAAGKRLGTEDDRHLWPEMLRAIREIQPGWVVGENVRGLTNWNGGMVFDEVQADLENEGYEVLPFLLPACAVNAPHRRDRIWFIAYSREHGSHESKNRQGNNKGNDSNEARSATIEQSSGCRGEATGTIITNTKCVRQSRSGGTERCSSTKTNTNGEASWSNSNGKWPTQSPICSGNNGLPGGLAGVTISKHRQESLKAYGNAIVPQVALQIFKAIEQYETLINLP